MDARPALLGLIGLAACEVPADEAAPFRVSFSFPADGEESWPETPVRLGFSAPIDADTCGRATFHLGALGLGERIAYDVPYRTEVLADENSYELVHDGLIAGLDHALVVQGGDAGCLSATGEPLEPFASVFPVVERPEVDD